MNISIDDEIFNLKEENIKCNNIVLKSEYNPHNIHLFIIGDNSLGPLFAIWGANLQDALDEAVDLNLMEYYLCDFVNENEKENLVRLGNAGELHDISDLFVRELHPGDFPISLTIKFAEARGALADDLKNI